VAACSTVWSSPSDRLPPRDIKPANPARCRGPPPLSISASRAPLPPDIGDDRPLYPGTPRPSISLRPAGPLTTSTSLSATLYHAISGHNPPTAYERMLEDTLQPLARSLQRVLRRSCAPASMPVLTSGQRPPQSISNWRMAPSKEGRRGQDRGPRTTAGQQTSPDVTPAPSRMPPPTRNHKASTRCSSVRGRRDSDRLRAAASLLATTKSPAAIEVARRRPGAYK